MAPTKDSGIPGGESKAISDAKRIHTPPDVATVKRNIKCPNCGYAFIEKSNGKSRIRTRVLVFDESGNAMGICPKCKTNLKLPIALTTSFHAKIRRD